MWEKVEILEEPFSKSLQDSLLKEKLYICSTAETFHILKAAGFSVIFHYRERGEKIPSDAKYVVMNPEEVEDEYYRKIDKRFKGVPWEIGETERCRIRETIDEDLVEFYRIYEGAATADYIDPLSPNIDEERFHLQQYQRNVYEYYGFGLWSVLEKETGKLIGRAGITMREEFADPELGFIIAKEYQRKGIAYEICSFFLELAKKEYGFSKLRLLIRSKNVPSLQLAAKLGFTAAGECIVQGKSFINYEITI